jgi:hypothetical protein
MNWFRRQLLAFSHLMILLSLKRTQCLIILTLFIQFLKAVPFAVFVQFRINGRVIIYNSVKNYLKAAVCRPLLPAYFLGQSEVPAPFNTILSYI